MVALEVGRIGRAAGHDDHRHRRRYQTNPADLYTKILSRQPFEKHRKFSLNLAADLGLETSRTSAVSRASSQRDGTGAL